MAHPSGLEIIHGPYGIFGLDTNNNVFDRLVTRDNYESGLHLQGSSAGNQILNLDSFGNREPAQERGERGRAGHQGGFRFRQRGPRRAVVVQLRRRLRRLG